MSYFYYTYITIFYRVNWKMHWLFLSEGANQLFSLILKLKQVKTSEKSSFVSLENHVFHEIFHSFLRVSASNSRREMLICARLQNMKPLHFPNYPIGCSFFLLCATFRILWFFSRFTGIYIYTYYILVINYQRKVTFTSTVSWPNWKDVHVWISHRWGFESRRLQSYAQKVQFFLIIEDYLV